MFIQPPTAQRKGGEKVENVEKCERLFHVSVTTNCECKGNNTKLKSNAILGGGGIFRVPSCHDRLCHVRQKTARVCLVLFPVSCQCDEKMKANESNAQAHLPEMSRILIITKLETKTGGIKRLRLVRDLSFLEVTIMMLVCGVAKHRVWIIIIKSAAGR